MVNEKSIKWIDKINLLIAAKAAFSRVIHVVVKKIKEGGHRKKITKENECQCHSNFRTLSMHLRACVIINFFFLIEPFFLIDRFSDIDVLM